MAQAGEAALEKFSQQVRSKRAAKALLALVLAPPKPSLASIVARYREAGLLQPSRKGARPT
jgi:hypothetical protein